MLVCLFVCVSVPVCVCVFECVGYVHVDVASDHQIRIGGGTRRSKRKEGEANSVANLAIF